VIAENAHPEPRRAYDLSGTLPVLAREFITQRISQLEVAAAAPDHGYEREQLLRLGSEFWNFLGDDLQTSDLLLGLYREVGGEYAEPLDNLREALAGRPV
jgi:hypothetical protein